MGHALSICKERKVIKMKNRYFIAFILGLILMPLAHKYATIQRGYVAYGGEILLIPLFMIGVLAADQVKEVIRTFKDL